MDELAKQFADLAHQYGPAVANAAESAARVEAYSCLMSALLGFVVAGLVSAIAWRLFKKIQEDEWDEVTWLPIALLLVIALACLITGIWNFIDPWTWTAIFHPDLWLAKRAFGI